MFNIFKKNSGKDDVQKDAPAKENVANLLEFIVKRLVDSPEDVKVTEVKGERTTVLEIRVNDEDMGKVIGKKGRIIKSLRIVVRAAALHEGQSVSIELVNGKDSE